jgi:acyl-CoA reductase-like NAD-dependent aldehyde dehydrogenase
VVSELGGKAPMIMFADCDVEQAVNGAAFASFVASGQTCIMGARLIVHSSIMDRFMAALVAKANRIRLGDPFDADTQMGPVISAASRSRIKGMVDDAGACAKLRSIFMLNELPFSNSSTTAKLPHFLRPTFSCSQRVRGTI